MGIVNVIRANKGRPSGPPPPSTTYYSSLKEGVVSDSGYYDSFPMAHQLLTGPLEGAIQTVLGRKGGHAAAGDLIIKTTLDGGDSWTEETVKVGGVEVQVVAHQMGWNDTTGRQILFYQLGTAFDEINWATRNGATGDFTYRGTISASAGCDWIAPCPVELKQMPEGEWRFAFYEGDNAGALMQGGFYESSNNGITFTFSHFVYSRTAVLTGPVSTWMVNEWDWLCIDDTGDNTTSKFIVIGRLHTSVPDGGVKYAHFKSLGGTTWTQDSTADAGSFVDDNGISQSGPFTRELFWPFLESNSPVYLALHNGKVIIGNGERNVANGYKHKITWTTPAGAYENKFSNWIRPITVNGFNATDLGSSIDCGYNRPFKHKASAEATNTLAYQHYDVSPYTRNPVITDDRCHIYQDSLEDWLYFPAGTPRTDIITGPSFFSGYTSDFNADHSYDGDAEYIQLAAGTYTNIQFRGKAQGVKIVGPESGIAEITEYIAFGDWTKDCVLMSHPNNPLREESLVFNDSPLNYFTIYSRTTGSVLVKGVKVAAGRIGMQIETRLSKYANLAAFPMPGALDHNYRALDTDIEYHWEDSPTNDYVANTFLIAQEVQNVKLLNSVIDGTDMEGIYGGADQGSPIPTNITVRNVHTLTTGRDGIQLRNGYMKMIDVQIDNAGDDGEAIHGHGAPIGSNSTGALLRRVKVNAAFANSLFSNALGTITCELCYFEGAGENGGYINNYTSTTENIFNKTSITYNLVNCHFEGVNKALWIQRDAGKLPMTVNRTSTNTYTGAVTIETGNGIIDNVLT
jgi:hypothetical protein